MRRNPALPIIEPVVARAQFFRPSCACRDCGSAPPGRSAHRCGPGGGSAALARPCAGGGRLHRRARRRRIVAIFSQHIGDTAASSIAMPAPCARNGSIGWAASPISVTAPCRQSATALRSIERPFEPCPRQRDQAALFRPTPRAKCAQNFGAARRPPQPVSCHSSCTMATMLMRAPISRGSARDAHRARAKDGPAARGIFPAPLRRQQRAPGGAMRNCAAARANPARAHVRPQAVGADQRDAVFVDRAAAAVRLHGDAVGVGGEILDPHAELEIDIARVARGGASAACRSPRWIVQ